MKIGNEYYRQVVGIPQGSVLSAILCSFFYGDLERRAYKFTEDPDCVRTSPYSGTRKCTSLTMIFVSRLSCG